METNDITAGLGNPQGPRVGTAVVAVAIAAVLTIGGLTGVAVMLTSTASNEHGASETYQAQQAQSTSSAAGAQAGRVTLEFGNFWLKPPAARVSAGRTTFLVRNESGAYHDLMIERVPIEFEGPNQPVEMAAEAGVEGLSPGEAGQVVVRLRPGRYELFCSVPGHYANGLHTELTVIRGRSGSSS